MRPSSFHSTEIVTPTLLARVQGEAVDGDQRREFAGFEVRLQPIGNGPVIRLMDLLPALPPRGVIEVEIARNGGAVAVAQDTGWRRRNTGWRR